jgi:hypothetical protein
LRLYAQGKQTADQIPDRQHCQDDERDDIEQLQHV